MTPELIAETGSERQHRKYLRKLLRSTKGPVRIASAYVTEKELLFGLKNRKVHLRTALVRMDIVSGATSLHCLRSLIEAGVQCRCLSDGPRLHAKAYIFGDENAVVTSANFTKNALDSNIEVGVRLTGTPVKELIAWFDGFWVKAGRIDLLQVSKWDQETLPLRRAFAALRKKAARKPALPNEAKPSVLSSSALGDLLDSDPRFFVCNTNRRYSDDAEDLMRQRHYAAVWEDFRHPSHMERVRKGDAIFMWAKGAGIIGVGRAKAGHEILPSSDPDRIRNPDDDDAPEWRVPVDWLVWAENDEDAFPWTMPNASFLDTSGDGYCELRERVREHFLAGR